MMKNKPLILLIVSLVLGIYLVNSKAYAQSTLVTGSNIHYLVAENGELRFQHDYIFEVTVVTGSLNGTNGTIRLTGRSGTLTFISSNDSTIQVSSSDAPNGFRYTTEGVSSTTQISEFVYQSNITSGNNILIRWSWNQYSFVDEYFMLGVGVFGITLMVFAPTWTAFQVVKKAYDFETVKRIGYSLFLFIIGFGLFITWLWPT